MQELDQTSPVLHNLPAKPMKTNSTSDKVHCVKFKVCEKPHETEAALQIERLIVGKHFNRSTVERLKHMLELSAIIEEMYYQGDAGDENDAKRTPFPAPEPNEYANCSHCGTRITFGYHFCSPAYEYNLRRYVRDGGDG